MLKYLKENETAFILNSTNYDLFHNNLLNKQMIYLYKLVLISILIMKFLIFEYNFDAILRMQMKKIFSSLSENICLIFDKFIFQNMTKSFNNSYKNLIEKIQIIARSNNGLTKSSKKNKVTETILLIQKSVENSISSLKLFSR